MLRMITSVFACICALLAGGIADAQNAINVGGGIFDSFVSKMISAAAPALLIIVPILLIIAFLSRRVRGGSRRRRK